MFASPIAWPSRLSSWLAHCGNGSCRQASSYHVPRASRELAIIAGCLVDPLARFCASSRGYQVGQRASRVTMIARSARLQVWCQRASEWHDGRKHVASQIQILKMEKVRSFCASRRCNNRTYLRLRKWQRRQCPLPVRRRLLRQCGRNP